MIRYHMLTLDTVVHSTNVTELLQSKTSPKIVEIHILWKFSFSNAKVTSGKSMLGKY